jgi:hypothetical protein
MSKQKIHTPKKNAFCMIFSTVKSQQNRSVVLVKSGWFGEEGSHWEDPKARTSVAVPRSYVPFDSSLSCILMDIPWLLHTNLCISPTLVYMQSKWILHMFIYHFFFQYLGLNSGPTLEPLHQCSGVSWTICLDWLRTMILLTSASSIAVGVSYWCLVYMPEKKKERATVLSFIV